MGNGSTSRIEVVAFDGDDTLWHSESHFVDAHQRFCALLAPYVDDPDRIDDQVVATERQNLALYGYGVQGVHPLAHRDGHHADRGPGHRRRDQRHPRPGQAAARPPGRAARRRGGGGRRAGRHRPPADHRDQGRPVPPGGQGGRARAWPTGSTGSRSCPRRTCPPTAGSWPRPASSPSRFLMIGNSVKSDVLPVVELGGHAAHLPYTYTWELEHVPDADADAPGLPRAGVDPRAARPGRALSPAAPGSTGPAASAHADPHVAEAARAPRGGRCGRPAAAGPCRSGQAPHGPLVAPADGVERRPERRADAGVGRVLDHAAQARRP